MFKTTCTRRSTFIGILFTVITICVLIVSGCASKPAATAPSTSAATTPAPVQQEVFKWRFQDVATKGQIHFDWRTRFVERVNEMSNGRLVITQYPAGALVNV
jgi:TRAP-type mannitol/chloroaromatic compound transport system substrate-binding protein